MTIFFFSSPVLGEPRALEMPSYTEASAFPFFFFFGGGGSKVLLYCYVAQAIPKLLAPFSCLDFLLAGVTGMPSYPADFFFKTAQALPQSPLHAPACNAVYLCFK